MAENTENAENVLEFEPISVTAELQPLSSSQLSLGNRAHSASSDLLNCTVSVTVSDLRRGYFIDGQDGETRHDGVVVVLEFEFGSQSRRSWNLLNRLSVVKIDVSVIEEGPGPSTTPGNADSNIQELRILERYPISARSHGHQKSVKTAVIASLDPSVLSVSGGNLSASRETITTQTRQVTLSSHARGDMCIVWRLEEEGGRAGERGVPDTFVGAVLLQTDGLPFSLDVRLDAPVLGSAYRAKASVPIGARALWDRKARDGWERKYEWSDFDSDAFKAWIKLKTRNGWAASAKYSADDTW